MSKLIVKDFEFTQNAQRVFLVVDWPSTIILKKSDVYINSLYLKINSSIYLFELDLVKSINSSDSVVTIYPDRVTFDLQKTTSEIWDHVQYKGNDSIKRRHEAIEADRQCAIKNKENRGAERAELYRTLVQRQMDVEAADRKRLADIKAQERTLAQDQIDSWINDSDQARGLVTAQEITDSDDDDEEIKALREKYQQIAMNNQLVSATVAPKRQIGSIQIQFTPRVRATAARESEDAKWAAQMEMARQRPVNGQLIKLRNKAMDFYNQQQYSDAIQVFTDLLTESPNNYECLKYCALSHYALKQYDQVVENVNGALAILQDIKDSQEFIKQETDELCAMRDVANINKVYY